MTKFSALILGGGFFGLSLAAHLSQRRIPCALLEAAPQFMTRASFNNQARVHSGCHYPRSVLTALRCRALFPRFLEDFGECVYSDFQACYLVSRHLSKVTAAQFERFCTRIGADLERSPAKISSLCNPALVESAFTVTEYAFDAAKLRDLILERLNERYVTLHTNTKALRVCPTPDGDGLITLACGADGGELKFYSRHVFNCTYSGLNKLLAASALPLIPLKHELTEMALVQVPPVLEHYGLTLMCGPFFSVMPFPPRCSADRVLHTLSHVRYTPHYEWHEPAAPSAPAPRDGTPPEIADRASRHSAASLMLKDAARYVPVLAESTVHDLLWEVKTVLPKSETDDSRPILCRFDHGLKGLHCVLGGKIDNALDVLTAVDRQLEF